VASAICVSTITGVQLPSSAQPAQRLAPIHLRHHRIHDEEIGRGAGDQPQRRLAIGGDQ